jgi:DNA-binding NarL/FixJ family response regulator
MIKIILIDDHKIVRNGIRMILESNSNIHIIGEYESYIEYSSTNFALIPDIYLIDISMPEINGIEATKLLKQALPHAKVIILTMFNQSEFIIRAINAGVSGYLPKNISKKELLLAIEKVYQGEEYFAEEIQKIIIRSLMQNANPQKSKFDSLSNRELELLKLIVEGKSNKDIADELFISIRTVESHKNHIMIKLDMKNKIELIKLAIKQGITEL